MPLVTGLDFLNMRDNGHQCLTLDSTNWMIAYASPSLESVLGFARGELEGKNLEVIIPDSQKKIHLEHLKKYVKNPTARAMGFSGESMPLDVKVKLKDGVERPVTIGLYPEFKYGVLYVTATILFRVS